MQHLSRLISIIYRHGTRFFDYKLLKTEIGYGQQFFLLCIHENPGINMQRLSQLGRFDKGTVTKAVKKLESQGYLRREADEADRRISHLYLTDSALPLLEEIYNIRIQWNDILVKDLTDTEIAQAEKLLTKISENAYAYIIDRRLK